MMFMVIMVMMRVTPMVVMMVMVMWMRKAGHPAQETIPLGIRSEFIATPQRVHVDL
jgi:hypothetical protein